MSTFQRSTFNTALQQFFPGAIPESVFVAETLRILNPFGFNERTSLPCVCLCRDELTGSLTELVQDAWGKAFNFSSLAGMVTVGRTGFEAAHMHAPMFQKRERYVYFAMPHISISANGEPGICSRPGVKNPSVACGALAAFHDDLSKGDVDLELKLNDIEQSLLKRRLAPMLTSEAAPALLDLTHLAAEVILEDLETMIGMTLDTSISDYAVITGIQVHGPKDNFIFPRTMYACVSDHKTSLVLRN